MNVELSYDKEFSDLLNNLKDKYGAAIFELEGIGSQLDLNKFSKEFFSTKVTADASIDDNSNVGDSSIISYSVELTKSYEKLNSLYLMWKEMRRLYHTDVANNLIEMYISGDLYIHDFYTINKYYCMNYSTYDIINKGLPMVHKIKCSPPKYLHSFKSQLEQFIVIASNSSVGASGTSDLFVGMSYYVKKLVDTLSDGHFKFASEDDVWAYVRETIVSLIYTFNQPFRGGIQCVTENTKILTPDGLKHYTELSIGDLVYTFKNGEFRTQPILKMNVSHYNGMMHRYGTQVVTPNHRVVYKYGNKYSWNFSYNIECVVNIPHVISDGYDLYVDTNDHKYYPIEEYYNGIVWCPTTDDGIVVFNNEDATFISGNSAFTNVSIYDKYFLEDLIPMYIFEDGSTPDINIVNKLQDIYLDVMNSELNRTAITFPVTSACFSVDDTREFRDPEFVKYIIEKNKEFGFMNFFSGNSSTNSGCCRLRSDMKYIGYANSIGGSSTKIGSIGVTTINMYRLAKRSTNIDAFKHNLAEMVGACARINHTRRTIIRKKIDKGFAPMYTYGFLSLDKQFSTCGISAFYEAMCELGIDITSDAGLNIAIEIIDIINAENKKYDKTFGYSHNCEAVPAESASVKIAQKDRLLGYNKEYELYSNQFIPLTASADILERIKIQGALDSHFSGGSILHLNFDQRIDDVDKIYNILHEAVKQGVIYSSIVYVLNECENGHMNVGNIEICSTCGGQLINKYMKIVGYLSNVKNWNKTRRSVDFPNRKFYKGNSL